MKIHITAEFEAIGLAFEERQIEELMSVLEQVKCKALNQLARPAALCTHPEADDLIKDSYGNTIGNIVVCMEKC